MILTCPLFISYFRKLNTQLSAESSDEQWAGYIQQILKWVMLQVVTKREESKEDTRRPPNGGRVWRRKWRRGR